MREQEKSVRDGQRDHVGLRGRERGVGMVYVVEVAEANGFVVPDAAVFWILMGVFRGENVDRGQVAQHADYDQDEARVEIDVIADLIEQQACRRLI
jgi:hypothetical protein